MKFQLIESASLHLKTALPPALWRKLRSIGTMLVTPLRFSLLTSHWKSSLLSRAVDAAGNPMPWYTFPMVELLRHRQFSGRSVLEFGGGQSSLWWAQRAAKVVTVESDEAWHNELKTRIDGTIDLRYVPFDPRTRDVSEIAAFLQQTPAVRYDIIVVDGHLREECVALAVHYLTGDGALIFDNSDGYGFREFTIAQGLQRIDF